MADVRGPGEFVFPCLRLFLSLWLFPHTTVTPHPRAQCEQCNEVTSGRQVDGIATCQAQIHFCGASLRPSGKCCYGDCCNPTACTTSTAFIQSPPTHRCWTGWVDDFFPAIGTSAHLGDSKLFEVAECSTHPPCDLPACDASAPPLFAVHQEVFSYTGPGSADYDYQVCCWSSLPLPVALEPQRLAPDSRTLRVPRAPPFSPLSPRTPTPPRLRLSSSPCASSRQGKVIAVDATSHSYTLIGVHSSLLTGTVYSYCISNDRVPEHRIRAATAEEIAAMKEKAEAAVMAQYMLIVYIAAGFCALVVCCFACTITCSVSIAVQRHVRHWRARALARARTARRRRKTASAGARAPTSCPRQPLLLALTAVDTSPLSPSLSTSSFRRPPLLSPVLPVTLREMRC